MHGLETFGIFLESLIEIYRVDFLWYVCVFVCIWVKNTWKKEDNKINQNTKNVINKFKKKNKMVNGLKVNLVCYPKTVLLKALKIILYLFNKEKS